jgi:hypothetical protein
MAQDFDEEAHKERQILGKLLSYESFSKMTYVTSMHHISLQRSNCGFESASATRLCWQRKINIYQ